MVPRSSAGPAAQTYAERSPKIARTRTTTRSSAPTPSARPRTHGARATPRAARCARKIGGGKGARGTVASVRTCGRCGAARARGRGIVGRPALGRARASWEAERRRFGGGRTSPRAGSAAPRVLLPGLGCAGPTAPVSPHRRLRPDARPRSAGARPPRTPTPQAGPREGLRERSVAGTATPHRARSVPSLTAEPTPPEDRDATQSRRPRPACQSQPEPRERAIHNKS